MKFGKEANNIEDPLFEVTRSQVFINDEEVQQKILNLSPKEVREFGIRYRSTLKKIKDMILKDGKINIKTNEVKKLIKFLYHT
ncbi:hypothetical protein [Methanosarcina mazei]|jgi:hypothetical protein|uniref:Uncharacterized protein n=3 Tax=Methanosarcina mazei TaxID=2209 RepID=A0A0F8E0U6_METMZ|nr:hypothetical protein [Methanosarcina mazei]AKB40395.1 hypothetical protein MSMAW_1404 [Methanosarcina mazei WWM610]AKB72685.1 hypothetical protein MSMAC_2795 [Methanosarcina mazei C16]KKG15806.1 hypothetical protein DU34_01440 [Methanosarcina mazei]KKG33336.1 hypothetical protein DU49_19120 [Methanosarcina mazei]KKG41036.1 hypothetical protein DU35_01345 [Methanosarcina mazei]